MSKDNSLTRGWNFFRFIDTGASLAFFRKTAKNPQKCVCVQYVPSTTTESSSSAACASSLATARDNTAVKHKQIPNRNNPMVIAKMFPAKNFQCHRGALAHAMLQFYKLALIKRVSCICPLHIPDKKISICENEIWPQIRQPDLPGDVNNPPRNLRATQAAFCWTEYHQPT